MEDAIFYTGCYGMKGILSGHKKKLLKGVQVILSQDMILPVILNNIPEKNSIQACAQ